MQMTINHNFSLPYILSTTWFLLAFMTLPSFADRENDYEPDFAIGDDGRSLIICRNFTGESEITIRGGVSLVTSIFDEKAKALLTKKPLNASNIGFFYVPYKFYSIINSGEDGPCLINSPKVTKMFMFDELPPSLNNSAFQKTVLVENPGKYLMFYQNCEQAAWVTMSMTIEVNQIGTQEFLDSVPYFFHHLRIIMAIVAPVYLIYLAIWLFICTKNRIFLNKYHGWMSMFLLIQFLESLCAMDYNKSMFVTGLCLIITSLFYITVFILIQACFRVLRTFLTTKDFISLLVPMLIQGFWNMLNPFQELYWIPYSYLEANSASGITFMVADALCSLAILVLLLRKLVIERNNLLPTATSTRNIEILRLFFKGYFVFVVYHMVLLQGMFVFRYVTSYELWWVSVAVHESIGVVFFGFIFYIFRPNEWNAYILWNEQPIVGI